MDDLVEDKIEEVDQTDQQDIVEDDEDRSFTGKLHKMMVAFNEFFFTERMEIISDAERIEREEQKK